MTPDRLTSQGAQQTVPEVDETTQKGVFPTDIHDAKEFRALDLHAQDGSPTLNELLNFES